MVVAYLVFLAIIVVEFVMWSGLNGLSRVQNMVQETQRASRCANGITALHSALASCAPGLLVVNVDNGYGAGCAALRILNVMRQG